MAYERINWENSPSTATPLNATNLNKMDEGIANLDAKFGNNGILDISKGGTGNNVGYIQTGYKALSVRGSKVTIEGNNNEASADYAHAEGSNNKASRNNAHVEGRYNVASGTSSHAEGEGNTASGNYSHAGGEGNVAGYSAQTVVGKYNNNKSDTLFEVGNGTNDNNRKNAFEVSGDGISTDNGTTKIRFGKNDSNQYGFYRGDDPNLILFDSSIASCAGIGKKTGVNSSGVIDTDIILGRNPEKGDRFLVYFDSKVDNANSMKIYVTSGSFVTPSLFEGGLIPPEYYLNGLCLFEYKVDNILSSYYLDLVYRKEDVSYTAGTGISINNNMIANSMPQLGDNVQCKSVDSVTQGRLGSYSGAVKYLMIHFDTDAEPYNGAYSLVLSYSGSVAIMKDGALYDRVMGMEYDRKIYSGSTLLCEIMGEGTGTQADPIHVDVLGTIDGYVTAGWGRQAALGDRATAEGIGTEASGDYAHAQGYQTTASGNQSTAMGYGTTASADGATAMGNGSTASGANSIAGGYNTTASGAVSTAIGTNTQATQQAQVAVGKYNRVNNDALVMVGNGTGASARSNALEVLLNGDVVAGNEIIDGQGNTLSVLAEALTKTASGNPIVITDCAGGKARSLKTVINAIQDLHGLPFPYVGGAYKNKLDSSAVTQGSFDDPSATANCVSDYTPISGGADYYMSGNSGYADGIYLRFYDANKTELDTSTRISKYVVAFGFTAPSTAVYTRIMWYKGGGLTPTNVANALVQLEIGTTATSYAPYSNECPISGRDSVAVNVTWRNLFDGTFQPYFISGGTYIYSYDVNCMTAVIPIIGGRKYTVSKTSGNRNIIGELNKAPERGDAITVLSTSALPQTVQTSATAKYLLVYVSATQDTVKLMVEDGETAHDYEPYAHSSATIQLGTTVYGGTPNLTTGVLTIDHALIDMDAQARNWRRAVDGLGRVFFYDVLSDGKKTGVSTGIKSYCTCFNPVTSDYNTMPIGSICVGCSISSGATCGVAIRNEAPNVATFLGLISGQKLCYELATPITIQLTPTQLEMLKGYNRVTIESGSIELGYIAKIA